MDEKKYYWIGCPHCGNPKMQLARINTSARNLPAYCKRCKTENLITIEPKSREVRPNEV